jgi:peptidyl-prolyl cis-trans isomerase SDCCAG10
MSNLYNLEPQPTAKVLLQTTYGDILLELFAKQTPLASRNFLQHCLDGYYNDTIFHRLVPGFVVQGGDPTGTGFGGKSALDEDGAPFADEFHSRLKYNRRGLVGMANGGKKNDNTSQFFITLGPTPELAGNNTLFGRVATGDTIYNVMKMADAELAEEGGDRPLYPTKITGAEILLNPFEDMEKRDIKAVKGTEEKAAKKKPKRKAGKALLSFGGDEEEEGSGPILKKPKFNTKLFGNQKEAAAANTAPAAAKKSSEKAIRNTSKLKESSPPSINKESPPKAHESLSESDSDSDSEGSVSLPPQNAARQNMMSKAESEIAALKASLRRNGPETKAVKAKPKSALEAMIPSTSTKGRKRGKGNSSTKEEAKTLAMFNAFKNKLDAAQLPAESKDKEQDDEDDVKARNGDMNAANLDDDDEEAALCDLHFIANCQSCKNWSTQENDDEDEAGEGWLSHKLSFAKDRLGKDLEWKRKNEEELVVIDPRERAKELGVEGVADDPNHKRSRQGDRQGHRGRGLQSHRNR